MPYSLLSTKSAVPVVEALGNLLGKNRPSVDLAEVRLRPALEAAADKVGDPALADLGRLAPDTRAAGRFDGNGPGGPPTPDPLDQFLRRSGMPSPRTLQASRLSRPPRLEAVHPTSAGLVIDHTGKDFGGVSVFVFPSTTKAQRDSMLTRLADEKAYRRLAISKDTKWADIALGKMPVQQVRPAQDVSKAIALFEQLERLGVGTDPESAARANIYLRRRARLSRNGDLTEADVTEAAQYAAIADLAVRLADFAATKGGADFDTRAAPTSHKGGADFAKRQGWRRLRSPLATDGYEECAAWRSITSRASPTVPQLTRAVGSSFAVSRYTSSGFSWPRASLVEVHGLAAGSNEKREPSTIA